MLLLKDHLKISATFTRGIIFVVLGINCLVSFMATCHMLSPTCPFMVPLDVFLLMADFASVIFLDCLCFHPLLKSMILWSDTVSSVPDMKDDSIQVTVAISSLQMTCTHHFQKLSGNVWWNLSATAGGKGQYGFWGLKSHTGSQGHQQESCALHSCLLRWLWQYHRWGCKSRKWS